ncbi:uncharacterized protein LOC131928327 [Physella acuta]|uniref:uncharacterized protein LOC131928327 n=1 Tax=Physella acuta TaxID=109671 RepID=UPI0027DE291D|nr:uncharacterized protein LOC131928327 [Physella acuta]
MGLHDGMTVSFLFLAIADFNFAVVSLALGVSGYVYVYEVQYGYWFPVEPYGVGLFFANLLVPLSAVVAVNTSFIAVVRCICVSLPLYFKHAFRRETTVMLMSGFFLVITAVDIPVFVYMGMVDKFDLAHNRSRPSLWVSSSRENVKDIVWSLIAMAVPFATQIITIGSIIIMARALKNAQRFRMASANGELNYRTKLVEKPGTKDKFSLKSSGKLSGRDRQIVKQIVVISLVYILCNTPKIMFILAGVVVPEFALGSPLNFLYLTVSNIRMIFEVINSTINLPIYYRYNSKFRSVCRIW